MMKTLRSYKKDCRRSNSGVTFIEAALVIPIIIMLVFGIIATARLLIIWAILHTGATQGVSKASVLPGVDDIINDPSDPNAPIAPDGIGNPTRSTLIQEIQDSAVRLPVRTMLGALGSSGRTKLTRVAVQFPSTGAGNLRERLKNQPITVTVEAQVDPLVFFLPPITLRGVSSGYRETVFSSSLPQSFRCDGTPISSTAPLGRCPCPGDPDPQKQLDPSTGTCVCLPGTVLDPTSSTCVCPSGKIAGPNGGCVCPACPAGLVQDPTNCSCHCPNRDSQTYNDPDGDGVSSCSCNPGFTTVDHDPFCACEVLCDPTKNMRENPDLGICACSCFTGANAVDPANPGAGCVCPAGQQTCKLTNSCITDPRCLAPQIYNLDSCNCQCPAGQLQANCTGSNTRYNATQCSCQCLPNFTPRTDNIWTDGCKCNLVCAPGTQASADCTRCQCTAISRTACARQGLVGNVNGQGVCVCESCPTGQSLCGTACFSPCSDPRLIRDPKNGRQCTCPLTAATCSAQGLIFEGSDCSCTATCPPDKPDVCGSTCRSVCPTGQVRDPSTCGCICPPPLVLQNGSCACPDNTIACGGSCVSNNCSNGQNFNPATCRCECPAPKVPDGSGGCTDAPCCINGQTNNPPGCRLCPIDEDDEEGAE